MQRARQGQPAATPSLGLLTASAGWAAPAPNRLISLELRSPLLSSAAPLPLPLLQEYGAALKVVKVEADANKATLEKYKVRLTMGRVALG